MRLLRTRRRPDHWTGLLVSTTAACLMTFGSTQASASVATKPSLPAINQQSGAECAGWETQHPDWIFCDDFESTQPLVGPGRYFEYGDDDGDFVPQDGVGVGGSRAMRALWQTGEIGAGGLKLAFGRVPNSYIGRSAILPSEDFSEIFYRMYLRNQPGWRGDPAKLSRATVFTSSSDWSQAMIAHLWGDGYDRLLVDPVRCVGRDNRPKCTGYNDFDNMDWLGNQSGVTRVFHEVLADNWFCVEAHVRLNDPGSANGVQEFWVDDNREARRDGLDFVRRYTDYGINAVFFENYWNDGSPQDQARYFDNIVVSTERIGCLPLPTPPTAGPTPTAEPTAEPTAAPTLVPTPEPTLEPSATTTLAPTATRTVDPSATSTTAPVTDTPTVAVSATRDDGAAWLVYLPFVNG